MRTTRRGVGPDGNPSIYFVDTGNDVTFCSGGVVCDTTVHLSGVFDRKDPTRATLMLLGALAGLAERVCFADNISAGRNKPDGPGRSRGADVRCEHPGSTSLALTGAARLASRGQAVVELENTIA
jgi:hypothetical protein